MSQLRTAALACACALALSAVPTISAEPKQKADVTEGHFGAGASPDRIVEQLLESLQKGTVEIDGAKVGELTLADGLQALSKKHNVTFVILDEEFKAKSIADVKGRKSRVQKLDTKDMTPAEFLDVWLSGLQATYVIRPEYVEIVPLPAKKPESGAVKVRQPEPKAKGQPKPAAKKADPVEEIVRALGNEVQLREGTVISDVPLFELIQGLSKQHQVTFIIHEAPFLQLGIENIKEAKPHIAATQLHGLSLNQFLRLALDSMGATYLVRNNTIEIVPIAHAAKVTKAAASQNESGQAQLDEPLVSAVFKEVPLSEAVARVAEAYDLTAVVSPQAGDARTGLVSARMLNVPAEKALELLALQHDLRVVKQASAYLLTSKKHANELAEEKFQGRRQKIELEKLREVPAFAPPVRPRPEK